MLAPNYLALTNKYCWPMVNIETTVLLLLFIPYALEDDSTLFNRPGVAGAVL